MNQFWHDLRRLARRGRPVNGRIVLGLILLTTLATSFAIWFPNGHVSDLSSTLIRDRRHLTGFGGKFVQIISVLQLIVVVSATPIVCGGALPVERARGTLDLLRISQALPAAIILGKFGASFVYLGSYLLFCLP